MDPRIRASFLFVIGLQSNGHMIFMDVNARDMFQDELAISNLR